MGVAQGLPVAAPLVREKEVEDGDEEGGGLACPRLRLDVDVPALEGFPQGHFLDRRAVDEAGPPRFPSLPGGVDLIL